LGAEAGVEVVVVVVEAVVEVVEAAVEVVEAAVEVVEAAVEVVEAAVEVVEGRWAELLVKYAPRSCISSSVVSRDSIERSAKSHIGSLLAAYSQSTRKSFGGPALQSLPPLAELLGCIQFSAHGSIWHAHTCTSG
jgi:hypothetical protein